MKKVMMVLLFWILLVGAVFVQAVAAQSNNESGKGNGTEKINLEKNNSKDGSKPMETKNESNSKNETNSGSQNKTRSLNKTSFVPWQKRNESECLEGCSCHGAVMSCPTATGKIMTIQAGRSGNTIVITVNKVNVSTDLQLEEEKDPARNHTKLKAKLKNGSTEEIEVMPDEAEEKALEKLKLRACNSENNCNLTLKEEKSQLKYELQVERHAKLLAIFRLKMQAKAEVDAVTGELIRVKKPWWAFLASEPLA